MVTQTLVHSDENKNGERDTDKTNNICKKKRLSDNITAGGLEIYLIIAQVLYHLSQTFSLSPYTYLHKKVRKEPSPNYRLFLNVSILIIV